MNIERREAANDNLTKQELRQQRKQKLIEYGALITMVQEWCKRRQDEVTPERSPAMPKSQRMLIESGVTAMQDAAVRTEIALRAAEEDVDNFGLFENARRSRDALYAAYIEAEFNL
jgi:hypothetical protein